MVWINTRDGINNDMPVHDCWFHRGLCPRRFIGHQRHLYPLPLNEFGNGV